MSTSKTLFLEQQKGAFYRHHFDCLTPDELESTVFPFKPKGKSEFPPPASIFEKKFPFLPKPLKFLLPNTENKKSSSSNSIENSHIPVLKKSKLGVTLVNNKEDSDNSSIIIPEQIEEILSELKTTHDLSPCYDEELLGKIETLPMSKTESTNLKIKTQWIDDLVQSANNEIKTKERKTADQYPIENNFELAKSPIFYTDSNSVFFSDGCNSLNCSPAHFPIISTTDSESPERLELGIKQKKPKSQEIIGNSPYVSPFLSTKKAGPTKTKKHKKKVF